MNLKGKGHRYSPTSRNILEINQCFGDEPPHTSLSHVNINYLHIIRNISILHIYSNPPI